jgi:hypothetical protein
MLPLPLARGGRCHSLRIYANASVCSGNCASVSYSTVQHTLTLTHHSLGIIDRAGSKLCIPVRNRIDEKVVERRDCVSMQRATEAQVEVVGRGALFC